MAAISLPCPSLLLILFCVLRPGEVSAWRSELYPEDWQQPGESVSFYNDKLIQDFSYAGYRNGEEAIPIISGPVFDVSNYGADPTGTSDSTLAIQAAINAAAAAGGGVVFLPTGEFRVSPQGSNLHCLRISTSNIVLRGAGPSATFLVNTSFEMRGKRILHVRPASVSRGSSVSITADLPGPARRIPVANASAFAPGNLVRLDWAFTADWIAEHNQETWWSGTDVPDDARYYREVLVVNPSEGWIEVDVPTRYALNVRDNARVIRQNGFLTGIGIESLSIGNLQHPGTGWEENDYLDPTMAAYDTHGSWLIRLEYVKDSWVTNIHSRQPPANTTTSHMLSNGILLLNSLRITLLDCEMRRPQYGGGGGNGYMYRIQQSNECLIESCVADFSRHGFVISHAGTSGNVFLLCEDRETARALGSSPSGYITGGSGSDNHTHFSHSNLWDQCHAYNSFWTAHHRTNSGTVPHGLTSAHAVYWNTSGSGTRYTDIVRSEQGRYGYVIGTSGNRNGATNPTGGNTAPADHLEGIGSGTTLEPESLYLDQLMRRLTPVVTSTVTFDTNGGSTATPASMQVQSGSSYGPLATASRDGYSLVGWFTAASGGARVTAQTFVSLTTDHTLYAQWNALPVVYAGPDQAVAFGASVEWTPAQLSTAAWFDADDHGTITDSSGLVSQWKDKSGNRSHLGQVDPANQPSTGTVSVNGLNAINFDSDFLLNATGTVSDVRSVVMVTRNDMEITGASGAAGMLSIYDTGISSGDGLGSSTSAFSNEILTVFDEDEPDVYVDRQAVSTSTLSSIQSGPHLYSYVRDIDWFIGLDGSEDLRDLSSGTRHDLLLSNGFAVGAMLRHPETPANFFDGAICEMVLLSTTLSEVDRQKLEGYLVHKWGMVANLPLSHPYKADAPQFSGAVASLNGTASDAEGDVLTHEWSLVSGPVSVVFANPLAPQTTAIFTTEGLYTLRLTTIDGLGTRYDDCLVAVGDVTLPTPFEVWAGEDGVTFDGDTNGDGLVDGLAWLLGAGSPGANATGLLPLLAPGETALEASFQMLNQNGRGAATLAVEYSVDLLNWFSVVVPEESGTANGISFSVVPNGSLNEVLVAFPYFETGSGQKVFFRLNGTVN